MNKLEKELIGRCQTQRAKDFMIHILRNRDGYYTDDYYKATGVTPRQQGGLRDSFNRTYGAEFLKLKGGCYKLLKITGKKKESAGGSEKVSKKLSKTLDAFQRHASLISQVFA